MGKRREGEGMETVSFGETIYTQKPGLSIPLLALEC